MPAAEVYFLVSDKGLRTWSDTLIFPIEQNVRFRPTKNCIHLSISGWGGDAENV